MKIIIPCNWKTIDLLTTNNPHEFGEALRNHCFIGNSEETGCYSTFRVIESIKQVKSGKIFEEAKKELYEDIKPTVYHYKLKEKDCWLHFNDSESHTATMKIMEPYEIVCG